MITEKRKEEIKNEVIERYRGCVEHILEYGNKEVIESVYASLIMGVLCENYIKEVYEPAKKELDIAL